MLLRRLAPHSSRPAAPLHLLVVRHGAAGILRWRSSSAAPSPSADVVVAAAAAAAPPTLGADELLLADDLDDLGAFRERCAAPLLVACSE